MSRDIVPLGLFFLKSPFMDYFQYGNIKYFYKKKKKSCLFQKGNFRFLPKVHSNSKRYEWKKKGLKCRQINMNSHYQQAWKFSLWHALQIYSIKCLVLTEEPKNTYFQVLNLFQWKWFYHLPQKMHTGFFKLKVHWINQKCVWRKLITSWIGETKKQTGW